MFSLTKITVVFGSNRLIFLQLHHGSVRVVLQIFLDERPGTDVDVLPNLLAGFVNQVDQIMWNVAGVAVVEEN